MEHKRSKELFAASQKVIPGGVNSPVRAYRSVGMEPVFIEKARGCRLWDADGNEYVDFVASWGPMILGHAHPELTERLKKAIDDGTSFGAPTELELRMAELLVSMVPSIEKVRMVSSGTEAVMSALRLARGFTGREKILKFEGCYHGHSDSMLAKAGSGVTTLGLPDSPGVTRGAAGDTINVPYNDLEAVREAYRTSEPIAAIIVEPVAGNMGVVPPADGFLSGLREVCDENGSLLIFDEVITGFRLAPGGAQQHYGVMPDLTTLGKIIGGGLPVGAFGGRTGIMDRVAPAGDVYQAGTLSGNPLAMTAGIFVMEELAKPGNYERLESLAARLAYGLQALTEAQGIDVTFNRVGSMQCMFFTPGPVTDYASARASDTEKYARYFRGMIERGINLAPSQFEACFVGTAHTEADVDAALSAAEASLADL